MANCRKHTQKYLADQISYDDAHDALNRLLGGVGGGAVHFTKREERDHLDMERYALTLKHLLKYLRVQQTPAGNVITPQQ